MKTIAKSLTFPRSGVFLALLCIGAALGLSSCTSPIVGRIESNPQLYDQLSPADRALVARGEIREGMTKEAVFLAWGRADRVLRGRERGGIVERWSYTSSHPVYSSTVGLGVGWGAGRRYGSGFVGPWDPFWGGYNYGPAVVYVPYQSASVEFRNERVTKFMRE